MNHRGNITLESLAQGGLEERFAEQLRRVLDNVGDPAVSATAKRKLTIEVVIQPNERREVADVDVKVAAKLAQPMPLSTMFLLRRSGSIIAAFEPQQSTIDDVLPDESGTN